MRARDYTPATAAELTGWIEGLPDAEKNSLLMKAVGVAAHRFRRSCSAASAQSGALPWAESGAGARTAGDLQEAAAAWREEQERRAAELRADELARQAAAAAAERERRLDALALRQEQAWQQVSALIATTTPRQYDEAVSLLKDLQALGDRAGDGAALRRQLRQLREQNLHKPSLIQRLDTAGLQA
jgi:hypothetical protein